MKMLTGDFKHPLPNPHQGGDGLQIIFSKDAEKTIVKMDSKQKLRVRQAIEKLPQGDVKNIHGRRIETFRLRVGNFCILNSFYDSNTIIIEKIAPRGQAYKGD